MVHQQQTMDSSGLAVERRLRLRHHQYSPSMAQLNWRYFLQIYLKNKNFNFCEEQKMLKN
jgi:hypothetical protein